MSSRVSVATGRRRGAGSEGLGGDPQRFTGRPAGLDARRAIASSAFSTCHSSASGSSVSCARTNSNISLSAGVAIATPAGDAERRCRRALLEEWVRRETASFRLPPSRLALDPGDVVRLDHDGRLAALRLTSVAGAGGDDG